MANFRFPNTAFMAIDKDTLTQEFGSGRVKWKVATHLPASLAQVPKSEYKNIPADSPLGIELKSLTNVLRASDLGELLGLFDGKTAKKTGCTAQMIKREPGNNEKWAFVLETAVYPALPQGGRDALGNIFMMWGTHHENNGIATFMHHNPEFVYEDQGFTYVTNDILARAKLTDLVTGEPFTELPFDLGATPDGFFRRFNKATQQWEVFNCEIKCAANYLPLSGTEFPGISVFFNPKTGPYKKPKAYHLGQIMTQMLACETEQSFYGCWTLLNGMQVWHFKKDRKYLSMMLTLLKHVYVKFVVPVVNASRENAQNRLHVSMDLWKRVPTGYFENPTLGADAKIRKIYEQFVAHTIKITDMELPDIAKPYALYSDTFEVTEAILQRRDAALNSVYKMDTNLYPTTPSLETTPSQQDVEMDDEDEGIAGSKGMSIDEFTKKMYSDAVIKQAVESGGKRATFRNEPTFPNVPPEIPDYATLALYVEIHVKGNMDNWRELGIGWPSGATDLRCRIANVEIVMNLIYLRPFTEMMHVLGATQEKHKKFEQHMNVVMWKLTNIERYLVGALHTHYAVVKDLSGPADEAEQTTRDRMRALYFKALHMIVLGATEKEIEERYEAMFTAVSSDEHESVVRNHLDEGYKALDNMYHGSLQIVNNAFVHKADPLLKLPSAYVHLQCLFNVLKDDKFDLYQKFFAFAITTNHVLRIINKKN